MTSVETNLEQWFPTLQVMPDLSVREVPRCEVSQATSLRGVELTSTTINSLTHDADLSDLWDYYQIQIHNGSMSRDKIAARECNQRCKRISFVYPASVIHRHPRELGFGLRLMQLGYRYCKGCSILIPKSVILELEELRNQKRDKKLRRIRTENMPIKCPCCSMKTATAKVLIRRTKMGQMLFRYEGY